MMRATVSDDRGGLRPARSTITTTVRGSISDGSGRPLGGVDVRFAEPRGSGTLSAADGSYEVRRVTDERGLFDATLVFSKTYYDERRVRLQLRAGQVLNFNPRLAQQPGSFTERLRKQVYSYTWMGFVKTFYLDVETLVRRFADGRRYIDAQVITLSGSPIPLPGGFWLSFHEPHCWTAGPAPVVQHHGSLKHNQGNHMAFPGLSDTHTSITLDAECMLDLSAPGHLDEVIHLGPIGAIEFDAYKGYRMSTNVRAPLDTVPKAA